MAVLIIFPRILHHPFAKITFFLSAIERIHRKPPRNCLNDIAIGDATHQCLIDVKTGKNFM